MTSRALAAFRECLLLYLVIVLGAVVMVATILMLVFITTKILAWMGPF